MIPKDAQGKRVRGIVAQHRRRAVVQQRRAQQAQRVAVARRGEEVPRLKRAKAAVAYLGVLAVEKRAERLAKRQRAAVVAIVEQLEGGHLRGVRQIHQRLLKQLAPQHIITRHPLVQVDCGVLRVVHQRLALRH